MSSSQSAPPPPPPPLCRLVTHIDTSNFRRFPALEVCGGAGGGCIKEKRSLGARELWLLRELEQRLVRASASSSASRPRPPPPLCSLIKLSPFKSVTVVRAPSLISAPPPSPPLIAVNAHLTDCAQVSNRRRKDEEIQLRLTGTPSRATHVSDRQTESSSAFCGQKCRLLTRLRCKAAEAKAAVRVPMHA